MRIVVRLLAVLLTIGVLSAMPVRTADTYGYTITDVPDTFATYAQGVNGLA